MSARGFSTAAQRLLKLVGKVSLEDVEHINKTSGTQWAENVQIVANTIESQRKDVASFEIQGAKAHKSSKDPNET
ncbi:hypothetical protein CSUB01_09955 [Colletotrichum sublineola]|uniref:Uncharacterized protein n=1 Tax=Colletotrichum sublineola TaxID=1173701 RepID=A0A066XN11_COLSU|nr:hypothetical protein CSUB01_09955 [Colletotrichum sublineola]